MAHMHKATDDTTIPGGIETQFAILSGYLPVLINESLQARFCLFLFHAFPELGSGLCKGCGMGIIAGLHECGIMSFLFLRIFCRIEEAGHPSFYKTPAAVQ